MDMEIVVKLAAIAFLIGALSGCMGSTGWRFEIGVSPVKSLKNEAGLTQESEAAKGGRY